jgi:hypothetical protein
MSPSPHGEMDMSTGAATGTSSVTAETPMSMSTMHMTFFFSTKTPLYSEGWIPKNIGQYAATCIFLILLATIFRGLLAVKAWREASWADKEMSRRYVTVNGRATKAERISSDSDAKRMVLSENGVEEEVIVVSKKGMATRPWRLTTDPIRAVMDTILAGLGYLL